MLQYIKQIYRQNKQTNIDIVKTDRTYKQRLKTHRQNKHTVTKLKQIKTNKR